MIVDTSAILAILRNEPDAARYVDALLDAPSVGVSAGTYVEASIVIDAVRDPVLSSRFDDLVQRWGLRVEPFSARQAEIARRAFRDYGRGSGHAARLNFGDCFGYALARDSRAPLLYKGDDFANTDLISALPHP